VLQWDGVVDKPPSDDVIAAAWDDLQKLAAAGDKEAQYRLAMLMTVKNIQGSGSFSVEETLTLIKASAEQGQRLACIELGSFYEMGVQVSQDFDTAEQWYQRAISPDDGEPELQIGLLYFERQMYDRARQWFSKAAEKQSVGAIFNLGYLAHHGLGESVDYERARGYFERAAEKGDANAMAHLGDIALASNRRAEGIDWYKKAAQLGSAHAQYNLGVDHYQQNDVFAAERFFRQAAEQGHVDATRNVGVICFHRHDYDEAEKWLRRAAELGSHEAILNLATLRRQRALERRGW
jgi:TPR repeat protein